MMAAVIGLFELATLAGVVCSALVAVGSALISPLLRARFRRVAPAQRVARVTAWIVAPLAAATSLVLLCLAPSFLTLAGLVQDHCFEPAHSHGHLCLLHPLAASAAGIPLIVLRFGLASLFVALASQGFSAWRSVRLVRALHASSRQDQSLGVRLLPVERPLSLAAGLFRPQVLISSGLAQALPSDQLAAVVAHERAHASRRHALLMMVASAAALLHFPWVRRWLLAELSLACEEDCDDMAAHHVGGRLVVAQAIVAVERLFGAGLVPADPLAPAFANDHVTTRVERLLRTGPGEIVPRVGLWSALLFASMAAVVALQPVHHLTETLLDTLISFS